ncbi:MAG TPA: dTDP-4-dehydrorhamnose reductase [Intrasporangium sp.]|uniref:dTDP-4-dehydrorhamnose reductase n=1 Tax=Intrasporangium sp. TaxID=1925024 RepID=UPI002B481666|nr:dTDP-4-dehydrorhamnose reductase [Intrasporangium sp.]HKX69549.1 dTDP-4-dehydrorhamnose reductase [Intrasporangium sp.]
MSPSLRVLVTGATGMLAHDLVPALRTAGHVVTAVGRGDLDVTDAGACTAAAAGHDLVVNCAAWTKVDDAETHEQEAFAVNAVGAANIARAAADAGARVVCISTDYVFDGQATMPYAAEHPPSPRSAYGRTKVAGEWAVRALCVDSWVVRTAWLYGAGGPNFVSTMLRLAGECDTLDVVDDQQGQPTWTRDLADLIVRMIAADAPAGTYHGTSTGRTTWHGLARAVFEARGLDPERVRPTRTDAFPRPAARPAFSVLSHATLEEAGITPIRDWLTAVKDFVDELPASTA